MMSPGMKVNFSSDSDPKLHSRHAPSHDDSTSTYALARVESVMRSCPLENVPTWGAKPW